MKRSLFVLALAAALAMTAVPVHAADPATPEHPTWIVTLAPGTPASEHAAGLVGPLGGSVDYVYRHVLNGFAFRGSERAAQALEHNPNVLRVEPNRDVHMTGESASNGFFRIDADDTYYAGDRGEMADGTPVRIAVLDTGIMVNHIDLAPNLDLANSYNCISPGQSVADDQGHGTHVAGIAASANQGEGMVGVASEASLVGIKVLDSTGYGTDAQVICGLDHVAGLVAADGVPTVVNFSLGEAHAAESGCASSGMHQAICNLTDDGVTVVAAAGNSAADSTDSFYPAAYPETIAVSAFAALDTTAGSDGCEFFIDTFSYECDDELASFTNYGSVVDVTAPGVRVQSTTFDGGWGLNSGTSMAAPFASGVAALILAADRTLTPNGVRSIMQTSGECPDGTTAGAATCVGHGQWVIPSLFSPNGLPDPDGIPEPLIDAAAAVAATTPSGPDVTEPTVSVTSPSEGATVVGFVTVAADAADNVAVAQVEFFTDGSSIGVDTVAPYAVEWDSTTTIDGLVAISATATDTTGNTATDTVTVTVDNTAPVVTITKPASGVTYEAGVDVLTANYQCSDTGSGIDTCDGDLPNGASLDTSTPGIGFTFTVIGTDNASNSTTVISTYDVIDSTAPVISLIGDDPLTHEAGESFTDPGAQATDNVDVSVTIAGASNVNPGVVGAYTITYDRTDAAGNIATTVTRSVNVVDTVAPFVTISAPIDGAVFKLGSTVLADYACDDSGSGIVSCGGDATDGDPIDITTLGANTFSVTGVDDEGNTTTTTHSYTVELAPDTTAPVITLIGDDPLAHEAGESFTDPGAQVTDNVDATVTIPGDSTNVDPATPGTYTITYDHTDTAGNPAATVTRSVNVADTTAPTITLTLPTDGTLIGGLVDIVVAADDQVAVTQVEFFADGVSIGVDGTSPFEVSWDSTTSADGPVAISATATDTTGNSATDTTSVTVDNTAPVVIITTPADDAVYELNSSTPAAYACTGTGPGDPSCVGDVADGEPIDTTTLGAHTFSVTGTDTVGNTTTVEHLYTIVDNSASTTDVATSEITLYGTVDGDYTATHAAGGASEIVTETPSGGKPSRRTSRLEHTWTIPFSGGDGIVRLAASTGGDELFDFEYSFNGTNWTPMMTVDSGTIGPFEHVLPAGQPAGDLFIRVVDKDRSNLDATLDTVSIDHLYVESEQNGSPPGLVLEAVVSKVRAVPVVTLTWNDIGASWYIVNREDWPQAVSEISATTYLDESFIKGQKGGFVYQVCNAGESVCSDWVNVDL